MCRSCDEGGKRCKNDTSRARRHRRKAAEARTQIVAVEPNRFYVAPLIGTFKTLPEIKREAKLISNALRKPALEDETKQDKIDSRLEMRITSLGFAMAKMAEDRAGFDREAFLENYDETTEEFDVATENYITAELELSMAKDFRAAWVKANGKEDPQLAQTFYEKEAAYTAASLIYDNAMKRDDLHRSELLSAQVDKLTAEYRKIIAEVRDVGGRFEAGTHSDEKAIDALNQTVGAHYPSAWITASNSKQDNMRFKLSGKRAHYNSAAIQRDLDVADNPDDAREQFDYFFAIPIPVDEVQGVIEALEGKGKILGGREVPVNGKMCKIVQTPHQKMFDPTKDPTVDGKTPSGEGWRFAYHLSSTTGGISKQKAWVRDTTKSVTVTRPEILVIEVDEKDLLGSTASSYHEFVHRAEATLNHGVLMRQQEAWLRRRTTDPTTGEREDVSFIYAPMPNAGILSYEIGRRNSFIIHYVGKEYVDSMHREVLSVGAESLFAGSFNALSGLDGKTKSDDDHKAFTLGIFATA